MYLYFEMFSLDIDIFSLYNPFSNIDFCVRISHFVSTNLFHEYMKAWMSSNFGQIPAPTPELSALARLKNCCIMLCPL